MPSLRDGSRAQRIRVCIFCPLTAQLVESGVTSTWRSRKLASTTEMFWSFRNLWNNLEPWTPAATNSQSPLKWTLGVWKFLFHLGCIICLFISYVFWFWFMCLTLVRSCWRGGWGICYMLVFTVIRSKVRVEQLVLMVRTIVLVFLRRIWIVLKRNARWWLGFLSICWLCWRFLGCCRWGLVRGLLISNFGKISKMNF